MQRSLVSREGPGQEVVSLVPPGTGERRLAA